MKDMKNKKIAIAALVLMLCVSVAYASYCFINGQVNVNVEETFLFGVNYVGWEAPPDPDLPAGYYSTANPFICSIAMKAGEKSHGDPTLPEEIRDNMPPLTLGDTPALSIPSPYHTFNSFIVSNTARLDLEVTFAVTGETDNGYMVVWEYPDLYRKLNGYTTTVTAEGFIMKGIGVVAEGDAAPGSFTFTIYISRG